jgi:hypothetical protein
MIMDEKLEFVAPYKTSLTHAVYAWIDRLPGPYWLFAVGILVITGLLNLAVAWAKHVLPFGQINWYFATTGFFVSYFFFITDFLHRAANNAISEFITMLDTSENKKSLILFEFTHLPLKTSVIFFLLGLAAGLYQGISLFSTAPEMNPAFPLLEITMYSFSFGFAFIFLYTVFRSALLIGRLFEEKVIIDIFDQTRLHAISRYAAWLVVVTAIPTYFEFILVPTYVRTGTFLALGVLYWLVVLIVFWLPLRGVNRKLVAEKRRLMKDVNHRIAANFDLLHSKMDGKEYSNIADIREMIGTLQMERDHLKTISTWPWQTGTLPGLLTAVLLPMLGSLLIDVVNKVIK